MSAHRKNFSSAVSASIGTSSCTSQGEDIAVSVSGQLAASASDLALEQSAIGIFMIEMLKLASSRKSGKPKYTLI